MRRPRSSSAGFTLVEVLVALVVVAIGLAALMLAVSGTARTSGYLRDKAIAQWIGLNRLTEVRLNTNKFGANTDASEVTFANRTWHYDTRYFDTQFTSMKRVSIRVYAGDKKTKGNPLAEVLGYLSSSLSPPGSSNAIDWTTGTSLATLGTNGATNGTNGVTNGTTNGATGATPGSAPVTTPPATTTPTTPPASQ
jgi:general secretion pathway protein I